MTTNNKIINEMLLIVTDTTLTRAPAFLLNWLTLNDSIVDEVTEITYAREVLLWELQHKKRKKFVERLYGRYTTLRRREEHRYLGKCLSQ